MTLDELVERLTGLQAEGHGSRRVFVEDEAVAWEVSDAGLEPIGLEAIRGTGTGIAWFLSSGMRTLPPDMSPDQCEQVVRLKAP